MNWETFGSTFIFSSDVLIDSGITAAELDVEKASSCGSFIILNVSEIGFLANTLIVIM